MLGPCMQQGEGTAPRPFRLTACANQGTLLLFLHEPVALVFAAIKQLFCTARRARSESVDEVSHPAVPPTKFPRGVLSHTSNPF